MYYISVLFACIVHVFSSVCILLMLVCCVWSILSSSKFKYFLTPRSFAAIVSYLSALLNCPDFDCSIGVCKFAGHGEQQYVLVGTGKELILNPRSHSGGAIWCFRLSATGGKLELVHRTPVDDIPGAICPFQGRVLISVGKLLRIYDLGKKKMLRKCENKVRYLNVCRPEC